MTSIRLTRLRYDDRLALSAIVSVLLTIWSARTTASAAPQATEDCFVIEVVDEQTGRGVPLVELETVNYLRYVTDSNGIVALREPGLMNQSVFFTITSHGYEFPADMFGFHGKALDVKPGQNVKLSIKRTKNIAERLYRVTGEGIYADSVIAGRKIPIAQPMLNAQVVGSDSVQSAVYREKIYWFWGDTNRPSYPLGSFDTTGATSDLPGHGDGLDPLIGVNLHYFTDSKTGFVRGMVPRAKDEKGPIWLDGLFTVKDDSGRERLLAQASRYKDLGTRLERNLVGFDDDQQQFAKLKPIPLDAPLAPFGQSFHASVDGQDYVYFCSPYPNIRVKADWKHVTDLSSYESRKPTEASPHQLKDAGSGKELHLHISSVSWNEFRKKWIMIGEEGRGTSNLGEVWYAEAPSPEGPWEQAVKIVTHDKYSFYNPAQHDFFAQSGGRYVFFEGTFANTFAGTDKSTPRYEYNQIMYRLDLADPRLAPAQR